VEWLNVEALSSSLSTAKKQKVCIYMYSSVEKPEVRAVPEE
jgi:hypothetical protein